MKTHQEKLNELTEAIRKSIPRLMELSEGCEIKTELNTYKVFQISDNYLNVIKQKDGDITAFSKSFKDYTIIGHEPKLNDVLEWLGTINEIEDYLIYSDGEIREYSYVLMDYFSTKCSWDLSKSKLSDQSPELINFLHSLIPNK